MTRRLFHTRDRGAVLPIVALLLPVLMVMTAFGVDLGRQRASRRDMQAAADVIALDMARLADGRLLSQIVAGPPVAETALVGSAGRNGVDRAQLTLVWGVWDEATGTFDDVTDDTTPPNAAQITATETTDYGFQPGSGDVTRTAIAAFERQPRAEFLLGSKLVEVTPSQDWMIGQLLAFVIPGADVVGYEGLANAQVTLGELATHLTAGSVEQLLATEVTFRDLLVATANALEGQGNTAGVAVLNELLALQVQDVMVNVADVVGVDTTDPDAGLVGTVNVPHLLSTAAVLSGGANFISVPPTVLNVAGLGTVDIALHVVEGAIRVGTQDGASRTTSQVGADVVVNVDVNGTKDQKPCDLPESERVRLGILLGGLFALLDCVLSPLTTALLDVSVAGTIGLDLDVAGVTATQRIDCTNGQLLVDYVGSPVDLGIKANLATTVTFDGDPLTLLGIGVPTTSAQTTNTTGTATFDTTDAGPVHQAFADVATGQPTATIGAPTLGLAGILKTKGVKLTVVDTELPVLGDIAIGLVQPTLDDILGAVDDLVVDELSRLLGLNLGAADITPQWMDCDEDGSVVLAR